MGGGGGGVGLCGPNYWSNAASSAFYGIIK